MSEWKFQLCELNYDHREQKAVASVLEKEWLTMGEYCAQFERNFLRLSIIKIQVCLFQVQQRDFIYY